MTLDAGSVRGRAGAVPAPYPGIGISLATATLLLLFLLQSLKVLFGALLALGYQAVFPTPDIRAPLWAILPVAVLLAPALPVGRWLGRRGTLVASGAACALGRMMLVAPALPLRAAAAAMAAASAALFLVAAFAYLGRRGAAAAACAAIVLEQLLHLAGGGIDPTLHHGAVGIQVPLGIAALLLLAVWIRSTTEPARGATLERRTGGLRLRGALALGLILFLETTVLGVPAAGAYWLDVAYAPLAVVLAAVGALATVLILAGGGPAGRHRPAAVALWAVAAAGAISPGLATGWVAASLYVAGHGAALLLLGRALSPAGGRRGRWTITAALLVLVGFTAAYTLTFHALIAPALHGALPWVVGAAVLLLLPLLVLIPRPAHAPPLTRRPAVIAGVPLGVVLIAGGLVAWRGGAAESDVRGTTASVLRVGSYDVRYGFADNWRFDPEAIAETIEHSGADVVVVQKVAAGLPSAYGADLPQWLGERLGMRVYFAPATRGLLGDAILTRLPLASFESHLLDPADAEREQVTAAELELESVRVRVLGTDAGVASREQRARFAAILARLGEGPAILAGDFAPPGSGILPALERAGFKDAFEPAGALPEPTWPAAASARRIGWIWVRGYEVLGASVLPGGASGRRMVVAAIRVRP